MKLFLIIAVTGITMFTACKDDDKASDPSSLTIDQTKVDVLPIGGKTLINVNTGLTWNATVDADWVKISPVSGNGSGTVDVEIDRHTGVRRTAKINITAGSITKTVDILQRGQIPVIDFLHEDMTTAIEDLAVASDGESQMIIVRTNLLDKTIWSIDPDVDWIHIQEVIDLGDIIIVEEDGYYLYYEGVISNNVMANKAVILSIDPNADLAKRSGEIVFSYGDLYSDTLKVSQAGLRILDSDGYFAADKLPFRDSAKYELAARPWRGEIGDYGSKFGVLAYKVAVPDDGRLKIVDHKSPDRNIWFRIYKDKEVADKGGPSPIAEYDGTLECDVAAGTYYVFGILNAFPDWGYPDVDALTTIDYDIRITFDYKKVYFIGDAIGGPSGWNFGAAVIANWSDPGKYVYEGALLAGELKIHTDTNWGGCFRPMVADGSISSTEVQYTYAQADKGDLKWRVKPDEVGNYRITLDVKEMKIYFEKQ
jgi:hypothetical protein